MTEYQKHGIPVTSINALLQTIRTDEQVQGWFIYLAFKPEIKEAFSKHPVGVSYKKLKNILIIDKLTIMFLLIAAATGVIAREPTYALIICVLFLVGLFIGRKKDKCIEEICSLIINKDFEEEAFQEKTLYQIGEFYGRKYGVKPLLEVMTSANMITRIVTLYTYIFTVFIYPLDFWQIAAMTFIVYYVFNTFLSQMLVVGKLNNADSY